ncbi:MAG TPA: ATP-dependent DNA helicase [Candidatus Cloacimonadota bacterium]|nr:ATP-dependent DNA helicase [Candidatus Cloacimonadota bacterium]
METEESVKYGYALKSSQKSDIQIVHISVRDLVEFVLSSGDIVSTFVGMSQTLAGTRAHQKIQKSRPEGYQSEVTVQYLYQTDDLNIEISGRIDGLWHRDDGILIEEIKSTTSSLANIEEDNRPLHWAQAKIYAYIYALQNEVPSIQLQLTYYQLDSHEIKEIKTTLSFQELSDFFQMVITKYLEWARMMRDWQEIRDESLTSLKFPFTQYRAGQRSMAVSVYKTIEKQGVLFAQAPTGIGKTIAALFPALKTIPEGMTEKIFYLTARTSGRVIAENTLAFLQQKGLKCKSVTLTAKEKICFNPGCACDPKECEFAEGYFDREKEAGKDLFKEDILTREIISEYAMKHRICPFEFSLFMTLWADVIIADYNYVFDPRVYLRRFFEVPQEPYVFLVDEAHNLPDRARDMYSAEMLEEDIKELKKAIGKTPKDLVTALQRFVKFFRDMRKEMKEEQQNEKWQKEAPEELLKIVDRFLKPAERWLVQNIPTPWTDQLLDFYFNCFAILRTAEFYDERYITYFDIRNRHLKIKLFCLDPSKLIAEALHRAKSTIYFSATLLPMDYYVSLLASGLEPSVLKLSSPFPKENLKLLIHKGIATNFKQRESSYETVAEAIGILTAHYPGNFLVFFPSYRYMKSIADRLIDQKPDLNIQLQKSGMTEEEKEEFLGLFESNKENPVIAFAVMGGIFGEGIDLIGERLVGAIVVGVGLPQVCLERERIREYFDSTNHMGFEYAYMFPGFNRVFQAAGRVIRSETDKGVVLLIDDRFAHLRYKRLFPSEWSHYLLIESNEQIREVFCEIH